MHFKTKLRYIREIDKIYRIFLKSNVTWESMETVKICTMLYMGPASWCFPQHTHCIPSTLKQSIVSVLSQYRPYMPKGVTRPLLPLTPHSEIGV